MNLRSSCVTLTQPIMVLRLKSGLFKDESIYHPELHDYHYYSMPCGDDAVLLALYIECLIIILSKSLFICPVIAVDYSLKGFRSRIPSTHIALTGWLLPPPTAIQSACANFDDHTTDTESGCTFRMKDMMAKGVDYITGCSAPRCP